MSLQLKTLYNTLIGAWGGLVAWAILDLLLNLKSINVWFDAASNGAIVGMCIGALVSAFEGLMIRRIFLFGRGLLVGFFTGLLGGVIGLLIGELAYEAGRALFQSSAIQEGFRALGWAIFGIGIGVTEGVLTASSRRVLYGALGGVIGGLAGGLCFIVLAQLSTLQMTDRAIGFVVLGAFIGLFVGLIPIVTRRASLKVLSGGRNEGREFIVDKPLTAIGSSDNNDIGLYGDRAIARRHAEIRQEQGQFVIYAMPDQALSINGAPQARSVLQDGAQIRLGQVTLLFRRK